MKRLGVDATGTRVRGARSQLQREPQSKRLHQWQEAADNRRDLENVCRFSVIQVMVILVVSIVQLLRFNYQKDLENVQLSPNLCHSCLNLGLVSL